MKSDEIRAKFAEVLGDHNVGAFISSVMIAVMNSEKLQECTPVSIFMSALRAATLRLSVDPSLGQAYLVPYAKIATLIPGYKGLMDLAVRTGKYRYIHVDHIYEGEVIEEDRISGLHKITGGPTSGSSKTIGWIAAFQMMNGYSKTLYMTVEEIHAHAKKYNLNGYDNPKGLWKKDPAVMERKTALRTLLRKWGYMDPTDSAVLAEIEGDVIDGQAEEVGINPETAVNQQVELGYEEQPEEEQSTEVPGKNGTGKAPMTLEEAKAVTNRDGLLYGDIATEDLGYMARSLGNQKKPTPEQNNKLLAIQIILSDRAANKAQPVE
jgi:recombination protein RecT